jgi:hypothetical protein
MDPGHTFSLRAGFRRLLFHMLQAQINCSEGDDDVSLVLKSKKSLCQVLYDRIHGLRARKTVLFLWCPLRGPLV